jgi:hypothetical protein
MASRSGSESISVVLTKCFLDGGSAVTVVDVFGALQRPGKRATSVRVREFRNICIIMSFSGKLESGEKIKK